MIKNSSPVLNVKLHNILKLANLDPTDKDIIKGFYSVKSEEDIVRLAIKYLARKDKVDFSLGWYKHLSSTINEFYYRYFGTHLYLNDSAYNFRTLFKLYVKLMVDRQIYSGKGDPHLDYYIASQIAAVSSYKNGLMTAITALSFIYSTCFDNYDKFISSNLPPSLLDGQLYLFIPFPYTDIKSGFIKKNKLLSPDNKFEPYINIELPIIENKPPRLKKDLKKLYLYLYTLELLIFRNYILNNTHRKLLVSIEHFRVYNYVYNTFLRNLQNE